jgi:hypothetical protein
MGILKLLSRLTAAGGLLAALSPAVFGAPLDKNACAKLAQDMQNMKALEVDKLMENGPAWAASHLSPADLTLVRQYIDLDEQMKFRCSAPGSLVHLKHLEEQDEESAQNSAGAAGEPETDAKKDQSGEGEKKAAAPDQRKAAKAPAKDGAAQHSASGAH